ncbi:MAG: RNA polymerase sigma factor [Hyphomonadaceae bacterium]|nr:RNA polymerase sigma factor [Hyphomonadaceae bacterium]
MITIDPDRLVAARHGDRAALEALARDIERPVFNLAMRMLANRADAEDATQEILIRIITHLGAVREPQAAGAWAFRIACRHLVHERKQGRIESLRLTFPAFADDLATGQADIAEAGLNAIETAIAINEVKVGCTLAMLTCLSRPLRIAYIVGDVLELLDSEAASALEISAATYRQRLLRARRQVLAFTSRHCGIVRVEAPCRCARRVAPALASGRIARGTSTLGSQATQNKRRAEIAAEIEKLENARTAAALMRSNPEFESDVASLITGMFDQGPA